MARILFKSDPYTSARNVLPSSFPRCSRISRESSEIVQNRQPKCSNQLQMVEMGTPLHSMADTAYLVRFKGTDQPPELVIAATIEFHGEHLVFLRSDGSLAALFLLEIIESWPEVKL
jgi:hypothetical protein